VKRKEMGKCIKCGKPTKENLRYCYDCWQAQAEERAKQTKIIKSPEEQSHSFSEKVLDDFDWILQRVTNKYASLDEKTRVAVALSVLKATSHRLNSYYSTRKRGSATAQKEVFN